MAAVTIFSDFEAQENKVCHCFHCFPSICHDSTYTTIVLLSKSLLLLLLLLSRFSRVQLCATP